MITAKQYDRIMAKTKRVGYVMIQGHMCGGCLEWTGAVDSHGIPVARIDGKLEKVHRVMYANYYGTPPADYNILHTCNNPLCVGDGHLYACPSRGSMIAKMAIVRVLRVLEREHSSSSDIRDELCMSHAELETIRDEVDPEGYGPNFWDAPPDAALWRFLKRIESQDKGQGALGMSQGHVSDVLGGSRRAG